MRKMQRGRGQWGMDCMNDMVGKWGIWFAKAGMILLAILIIWCSSDVGIAPIVKRFVQKVCPVSKMIEMASLMNRPPFSSDPDLKRLAVWIWSTYHWGATVGPFPFGINMWFLRSDLTNHMLIPDVKWSHWTTFLMPSVNSKILTPSTCGSLKSHSNSKCEQGQYKLRALPSWALDVELELPRKLHCTARTSSHKKASLP